MGSPLRDAVAMAGENVEGRYRILKKLGEGGMGTVFLAEHALIKRKVAMKILHPELATDADVIERFMHEARAAGTLGHPNIVESTDMGLTQSHVPYIVFEYLEGALLTDEIYRVGGLPVRRAVRIAQQIASALSAAHAAGIVHRDLKSDNVFLTDKADALDHVKVLDFGISRFLELRAREDLQAQKGITMGTPQFMAPEQLTAPTTVDRRADIYALGVILYEMLAARRPFEGERLFERIVGEAPAPLGDAVPPALAELIVARLLAKDPDARPQTMLDVEAALEPFVARADATPTPTARQKAISIPIVSDAPAAAKRTGTLDLVKVARPTAPARRGPRWPYAIAALGLLVGAIGLGYGRLGGEAAAPAASPAALDVHVTAELVDGHIVLTVGAPGHRTARVVLDPGARGSAHLPPGDENAAIGADAR